MNAIRPKAEPQPLDAKDSQVPQTGDEYGDTLNSLLTRAGLASPAKDISPTSQLKWGNWKSLGQSAPIAGFCVSPNTAQRIEAFAVCNDFSVIHNAQITQGGDWSGWEPLPGVSLCNDSPPVVVQTYYGGPDLFGIGTDTQAWHIRQRPFSNSWSTWEPLGSLPESVLHSLSVARNQDGRLELLAVAADGQTWHTSQVSRDGSWNGWHSLNNPPGVNVNSLVVLPDSNGVLQAFTLGDDLALRNITQAGPEWTWRCIYQFSTADPVCGLQAVLDDRGELAIFVMDANGDLWFSNSHQDRVLARSDWSNLGQPPRKTFSQNFAVIPNQHGGLQAFVVGASESGIVVWTKSQGVATTTWGEWRQIGAPIDEQNAILSVSRNWDGRLGLFSKGLSDEVAYVQQAGLGNQRMINVLGAFESICDEGFFAGPYEGSLSVDVFASHIQGMASYGKYLFFPHNAELDAPGFIVVVDKTQQRIVQTFSTPDITRPHPGGCQVIGDYLAVSLERSGSGVICFYYLGDMTDDVPPVPLPIRVPTVAGAGAVGILDYYFGSSRYYLLAVYDSPIVSLYASNGRLLEDEECQFTHLGFPDVELQGHGADNLCLLADTLGHVYLVALTSDDTNFHTEYIDWAQLYKLVINIPQRTAQWSPVSIRHMFTNGGSPLTFEGIHFRYGAGIQIRTARDLELFCSARNFLSIGEHSLSLEVNIFEGACPGAQSAQAGGDQTNPGAAPGEQRPPR
jgi:hypothetical protein